MRISREYFGHRSGSASHTLLINSRRFLEGVRRGSWADTSITSTRRPRSALLRPPAWPAGRASCWNTTRKSARAGSSCRECVR
jgi:hypothetical protein